MTCSFKYNNFIKIIDILSAEDVIITRVTINLSDEELTNLNKRTINRTVSKKMESYKETEEDRWLSKFKQIYKK